MKQLLIISFILFSSPAFAQMPGPYYRLHSPVVQLSDSSQNLPVLSPAFKLPPPGIYRLRQDGMPCIVPDTKGIAPMPNAMNAPVTIPYSGNIPNPAVPRIFSFRNKKTG